MNERLSRTALLLGDAGMEKLKNSHVAIFGIGGVGGAVCESLARSGIGHMTLIDPDNISITNLNRQAFASAGTVGMSKLDAARERLSELAPDMELTSIPLFYLPETADQIDFTQFDYIVDAIDTITAKIDIIVRATQLHIPIISSMGTGNKLDPSQLEVADIYSTSVCPLARVMRRELKKRGIPSLKVVYSREEPIKALANDQANASRHAPASAAFVPNAAGLLIGSQVTRDLLGM